MLFAGYCACGRCYCCCCFGYWTFDRVEGRVSRISETLSLTNTDSRDRAPPQETSTSEPPATFPAGSFAFKADLQNTTTDCTSNPSTWRCYPYEKGSSATFFWIISSNNDSSYNISSTENPFAPSFTNLTLKVLDKDTSQERLQFSFSMNKTIVPDDQLSSSNRAAKCTFDDTLFEATLWTQRRRGDEV